MRTRLASVVAALTGSLVLSACGATGSNNSAGSSDDGPITLMTVGPVQATGFSLPSIPMGAQVAVDEINASGGVHGRKLKLITCNDQNDPNKAMQCARQAVKDKVAALVGGLSLFDAQIVPITERAGIPWIGLTTSSAYTNKNLFLTGSEAATILTGVGTALTGQGCENVAIVNNTTPVAKTDTEQFTAGVKAGGGRIVGTFSAPTGSADWAPTVAAVLATHPDCVAASTGPTESGPFVTALAASDKNIKVAVPSGGMPASLVKQLGKTADGVLVIDTYLPFSSDTTAVKSLREKVLAAHSDATLDTFVQTGYTATKIVAKAAAGVSSVDASTLMDALPKVTAFDTGLGPVIDLSKPISVTGFDRVFNPEVYVLVAKDGVLRLGEPKPLNVEPALKLLGRG
ncbi:ABC transporter substrate-binding protein [Streptomyces sp. NPDC058614]|uniref:ABC transporter substrate-binding protein n=1 Tax=Streptomyces sp. NPDC058614 TaxID=3346557 RepID=UPI003658568B